MKTLAILPLLTASVLAQVSVQIDLAAIANSQGDVSKRGVSSTELENGACKQITFIYARGSTEPSNMGIAPGPQTCDALKSQYGTGNVACQGVDGGKYSGDLISNLLPKGTTQDAIDEGVRLFKLANSKCPKTNVIAGGYSQGAALMAGAISILPSNVIKQVNSVVLYGYTKNKQNGGRIPNYPTEKTKIICEPGDLVCDGTLIITASHLLYLDDVPTAKNFYVNRLNNF